MTVAVMEQATMLEGSPLAEFAWTCDEYGAYIDALRNHSSIMGR